MKKLRYALLTLALLAPAGLVAQNSGASEGQPAAGPRHRHIPDVDQQLARLSKKLKLSDEQKPQVKAILQDQHDQMQQLWQNSSGSRQENVQKMHEIHDSASSKIRAVLTDDQKTKYDKLEAKRQQRMEKRHGGQGAPPAPASPQPQQ